MAGLSPLDPSPPKNAPQSFVVLVGGVVYYSAVHRVHPVYERQGGTHWSSILCSRPVSRRGVT